MFGTLGDARWFPSSTSWQIATNIETDRGFADVMAVQTRSRNLNLTDIARNAGRASPVSVCHLTLMGMQTLFDARLSHLRLFENIPRPNLQVGYGLTSPSSLADISVLGVTPHVFPRRRSIKVLCIETRKRSTRHPSYHSDDY